MAASNPSITLIGLGQMGTSLAHALLKASRSLVIWNRTASRPAVQELVQAGASYEPDLRTALSRSPIVIICVLKYDNIYQSLKPIATSLKDKTIINLTNGTPRDARLMSGWAHSQGVSKYYDGGIMATPQMVGQPESFILISGESPTAFADPSTADLITIFGRPEYIDADPGAASVYDLSLLAGMYGLFSGVFVALALMKKQLDLAAKATGSPGKTLQDRASSLLVPVLQFMTPYATLSAKDIDDGTFDDHHGNPMEMQRIAIENILRACEEEGVDGGNLKYMAGLMKTVVDEHGGETGVSWVHTLISK